MWARGVPWSVSIACAVLGGSAVPAPAQSGSDFARAERLLGSHLAPLLLGEVSAPNWVGETDRFWYSVRTANGVVFLLVDPVAGTRRPVFDNARLAAAMSLANDTSYEASKLPFTTFDLESERNISFRVNGRRFDCSVTAYTCSVRDTTFERPAHHVRSPDERWEAFVHGHDLYVRPAGGGDSTRLTTDGEEFWRYGIAAPRPGQLRGNQRPAPWLEWSPDSRRIAVARHDERAVDVMPMYSSTRTRPEFWFYRYGLPGDSAVSTFDMHVIDVASRSNLRIDVPPQPYPMSGLAGMGPGNDWLTVKWSPDAARLYFTHHVRARKRVQLMEADLATGRATRIIAKDTSATHVELNLLRSGKPNWFVLAGGDVVWQSERDGWAHLYRLDDQGGIRNRITSGPWTVADVLHIDETAGVIWFTARGREPLGNPYFRKLYRARLDGSGITLLTSEEADHTIAFAKSGRFFVDRWSAPDNGGAAAVRDTTGRTVLALATVDLTQLVSAGWTPPHVFTVKARDNVTDLWGLLFLPKHLDATRRYPIIVNIYPGPQIGSVGVWSFDVDRRGEAQALAELGFVVMQVDALGTPYRAKAFHDAWYGNMGDNGIPDQIAAVRQLAARHAFIDLERVGIYGHSGGGFSSTGAILRHPEFFRVAVSTSGNHDNRSYGHYWAEQYQGLLVRDSARASDNYHNQINALLAANLRGRLLIMHGDMDDNVHPAMTLQLVDALVKANRTFDLVILPDRAHGLNEPYVIRRRWEYFVRHLLPEVREANVVTAAQTADRAQTGATPSQGDSRGSATAASPTRTTTRPAPMTDAEYSRAERLLTWHTTLLVDGEPGTPRWMADGRFWYRVNRPDGAAFMLADPARPTHAPAFDNARLAAAMSLANDTSYDAQRLPFESFDFDGADTRIRFHVRARTFACDVASYVCAVQDTAPRLPVSFVRSPDGDQEAFVHDFDLHVRPAGGGDSVRLTTDGERYFAYGVTEPRANAQLRPAPVRPVLQWSPDSRRIAVQRTDERGVGRIMLYTVTRPRPRGFVFPYAQPGDSVIPRYDIHVIDVAARSNLRVKVDAQTQQVNGLVGIGPDSTWRTVKWSHDSGRLYFTHATRGPKRVQLMVADVATGDARVLAKDSAASFVELNLDNGEPPNWRVMNGGQDIIWFSERDGWGHLYRFDANGALVNRITTGPWAVATLVHADDATGRVWFTARGREPARDPYLRHLYVVNLDGSGLRLLTPEPGDHRISFAADGRSFVDSWSRIDAPPVTVLRAADGRLLRTLEQGDASRLLATGWRGGEPFTVKARDGVTDLYGVMWKPTNFDSTRSYPIIDHIYPGPQIIATPKRFFPTTDPGLVYAVFGQVQALAELGFIVINVDAMGTPYRSKAYLDTWYGDMGDNGLPDHIAAIRQLAARHRWIDIERVGIFGHSGGGFASTDAILRYPDFFDVAFSTSGNHDNRTYQYHWGEKYHGLLVRDSVRGSDNYESQANYRLAQNLKGRLFLVHGDMDDNVLPSSTLRVADALIRADRDFDLLILPDAGHGISQDPYVLRRMWDHFVTHLLGRVPPRDYVVKGPPSRP